MASVAAVQPMITKRRPAARAQQHEPKLSIIEILLVGSFMVLADAIDLILLFVGAPASDITDLIAAPADQVYLRLKGINAKYDLIADGLDLIPWIGDLPFRTLFFGVTVYADRHPEFAAATAVLSGSIKKGGASMSAAGRRALSPMAGGIKNVATSTVSGPATPAAFNVTVPGQGQQPSPFNIGPAPAPAAPPLVPEYNPIEELQQQIQREEAPEFLAGELGARPTGESFNIGLQQEFERKEEEQRQKIEGKGVYETLKEVGSAQGLPPGGEAGAPTALEESLERIKQLEFELANPQAVGQRPVAPTVPVTPPPAEEKPEEAQPAPPPAEAAAQPTSVVTEPLKKKEEKPPAEAAVPEKAEEETEEQPYAQELFAAPAAVVPPPKPKEEVPVVEEAPVEKPKEEAPAEPVQEEVPVAEEAPVEPTTGERLQTLYEQQKEQREQRQRVQQGKEQQAEAAKAAKEAKSEETLQELIKDMKLYGLDETALNEEGVPLPDQPSPFAMPKTPEERKKELEEAELTARTKPEERAKRGGAQLPPTVPPPPEQGDGVDSQPAA